MRTRFSTARNSIAGIAAALASAAFLAAATPVFAQEKSTAAPTESKLDAVLDACKAKMLSGEVKGFLGAAICSEQAIRDANVSGGIGYPDLVELFLAKRRVIAEQTDKGLITETEMREKSAEAAAEITDRARVRRAEDERTRAARSAQSDSVRVQEEAIQAQEKAAADARRQAASQALMQTGLGIMSLSSPRPALTCFQTGTVTTCQ
jgi:hypothetical protein